MIAQDHHQWDGSGFDLGLGLEASLEVFDPSGLYSSLPSVTFSLGLFLGENPEGFWTETLGHSEGVWP